MTVSDTTALTESVAASAPGALRFWVGGTATWDATVGTKWATATGGAGGAAIPIASDDVRFDANSGANTVTLSASSLGRSIDCTGFTGTISHPASTTVNIGDATAGQGSIALKLVSGMAGYTVGAATTSILNFVSTSATVQTVDSGTKVMPSLTFAGTGGSWQFAGNITATGATLIHTAGTLDMNGKTVSALSYSLGAGSTARTLTLGAAQVTLTSTTVAWNAGGSNATITANTATVTLSGASAQFTGNGLNYNGMTLVGSGSGTFIVAGANTFGSLTRTGTALKTDAINFSASQTITGTLTLNGNSAINRLLVQSTTFGTQVTLTVNGTFAAANASNVDFQDIAIAGSITTPVDLSAITGLSGDCGNNSGITFTTGATQYAVSANTNFSATTWGTTSGGSGGRVPLPQDTARIDANSGTTNRTNDMPRMGAIDTTGASSSATITAFSVSGGLFYGSLTLPSVTLAGSNAPTLRGRKGQVNTFQPGGYANVNAAVFISTWADTTWQLTGDLDTGTAANGLPINSGIFDANGYNITTRKVTSTAALARIVHMGSGNWTLTSTVAETIFDLGASGTLTVDGKATIIVANASANTRTFNTELGHYGTLRYDVAGSTGILVVSFAQSGLHEIDTVIIGPGRTLRVQQGGGFQLAIGKLILQGQPSGVITLDTNSAGSAPSCFYVRTPIDADYLSIKDITLTAAPPGGLSTRSNLTHYAGDHSTNVSNNTGWTFRSAPRANRAHARRRR